MKLPFQFFRMRAPGKVFQELRLIDGKSRLFLIVLLVLPTLLVYTPVVNHLEERSGLQWLFHWRGPLAAPEKVTIIRIDRTSAKNLGLPAQLIRWSRSAYATLLQALNKRGAQTIVFDISFIEDRPSEDQALAQAIREHGNVVLFKYLKRKHVELPGGAMDIEEEWRAPTVIREAAIGDGSFTLPKRPASIVSTKLVAELSNGREATQPLLALWVSHQHLLPVISQSLMTLTSLAKQASSEKTGAEIHNIIRVLIEHPALVPKLLHRLEEHTEYTAIKRLIEPLSGAHTHYINFYGPPETLHSIPIDHILNDKNKTDLSGTVVYVGFAESGQTEQQDAYRTVFTSAEGLDLSGVEISASVFANLLHDQGIKPIPAWLQMLVIWLLFLVLFMLYRQLPLLLAVLSSSGLFALYCLLALWFFSHQHWLPVATPLLLILFGSAAALYFKLIIQRQRQHNVETALAQYLPKEIAESLSYNVSTLESRHQLVQGVCLMTDIHGYTSLSEKLSPTALHQKLNAYYGCIIDIVNENGGAVANIVGDSLLAVWSCEKLDRALCETALETARKIIHNLHSPADGEAYFPTSIALHCGEFSLGHLGARNHFEYSPVGDIVNTTSRIEQLNRKLGTEILCSEDFASQLEPQVTQYQGKFELKNKQQPLGIYSVKTFD